MKNLLMEQVIESKEVVEISKTKEVLFYSNTTKNKKTLNGAKAEYKQLVKRINNELLYDYIGIGLKVIINEGDITESQVIHSAIGKPRIIQGLEPSQKVEEMIVVEENSFNNVSEFKTKVGPNEKYRFYKDIIVVSLSNAKKDIDKFVRQPIYMKDNKVVTKDTEGAREFQVLVWSPSSTKNYQCFFMDVTDIRPQGMFDYLDNLLGKAVSNKIKMFDYNLSQKDFKKLEPRLGITTSTTMTQIGEIGIGQEYSIGVLYDKFPGVEDFNEEITLSDGTVMTRKDFLNKFNLSIDNETHDGIAILCANAIKYFMKDLGLDISMSTAMMLSPQLRTDIILSKVYTNTLSQNNVNFISDYFKAKFGDRYRVYGNGPIGLIVDGNAAKVLPEIYIEDKKEIRDDILLNNPVKVFLLAVPLDKGSSKFSTQVASKLNGICIDSVQQFIINTVIKLFDDFLDNKKDKLLSIDKNGKIAGTPMDKLLNVDGDNLSKQFVIKKVIQDLEKYADAMGRKLNFSLKSSYGHAVFDCTNILSEEELKEILGYRKDLDAIEGYSTDVYMRNYQEIYEIETNEALSLKEKTELLDELLTSMVVKYPCQGAKEYQLVRWLTLKEVLNKIEALVNINPKLNVGNKGLLLKTRLKEFFKFCSFGQMIIAPINSVKNKLAGMDTDYDGLVAIFEPEIIEILKKDKGDSYGNVCANIIYNTLRQFDPTIIDREMEEEKNNTTKDEEVEVVENYADMLNGIK